MRTQDYLVDDQGNFRFTRVGLDNQAPLLAMAGFDAKNIKTYADYIQARQAASPYFMEYLQEETEKRLAGKPNTVEWRAIRSIVLGTRKEQESLLGKLRNKQKLSSV